MKVKAFPLFSIIIRQKAKANKQGSRESAHKSGSGGGRRRMEERGEVKEGKARSDLRVDVFRDEFRGLV